MVGMAFRRAGAVGSEEVSEAHGTDGRSPVPIGWTDARPDVVRDAGVGGESQGLIGWHMVTTTIKVEGLRELERALSELPKVTARATLRRTGLKALAPFVVSVKAKAPIDADPRNTPKRPPGMLRDSYVAGTKLTKRQARFAKKEGKSFVEVYAGTSDPAGVQTEFGNIHQAAQPHVRPAWDETKDEALAIVKIELGDEIAKSAARLAKKAGRK